MITRLGFDNKFGKILDIRNYFWIRTDKETVYYTTDAKPTVITFHPSEWFDGVNVFELKVDWMKLSDSDELIIVPCAYLEVVILSKSRKLLELPMDYQNNRKVLKSYVDDSE